MTTRVHVLSDGFASPNGRGVVYPLLAERRALADDGIEVGIYSTIDARGLRDCDLLVVDSKHFGGPLRGQPAFVIDALGRLADGPRALAWYDSTDSAGWIAGDVLAVVARYWKNQLLVDRGRYLSPLYGRRAYSDFYHHSAGVADDHPADSAQVRDARHLARLRLAWHSGLADHGRWGPLRMAVWQRLPQLPALVPHLTRFTAPSAARPASLAARMGTNYRLASVAWQRRALVARLAGRVATGKVGRGRYFAELLRSRAVLSPFGLGEITLKDFETFIAGAALVKPDMSHMETWPDLFRPGETMATFRWDLSDIEALLDRLALSPGTTEAIAQAGQTRYRHFLAERDGRASFREHVVSLVADAVAGNKAVSPQDARRGF